jgi:hypothetical protein
VDSLTFILFLSRLPPRPNPPPCPRANNLVPAPLPGSSPGTAPGLLPGTTPGTKYFLHLVYYLAPRLAPNIFKKNRTLFTFQQLYPICQESLATVPPEKSFTFAIVPRNDPKCSFMNLIISKSSKFCQKP